jgi:hypothetical protein
MAALRPSTVTFVTSPTAMLITIVLVNALFIAGMFLWSFTSKTRDRVAVLRSDMRELRGVVESLRDQLSVQSMQAAAVPVSVPAGKKPSKRQVDTAVSNLRRMSEELGENS